MNTSEIFIYGAIGEAGITAAAIVPKIQAVRASTLNVHVNSPGGSVFDGFAIYNALRAHPAKKRVFVDGIAASIASTIAMAGDEIVMAANAMLMVHNPSGTVKGGASEMRSNAEVVDKLAASMGEIYAQRSGLPVAEVLALMEAETWLDAHEAVSRGFATSISPARQIAAKFDLSAFRNAPESAKASAVLDASALVRLEFAARLEAKDREIADLTGKLALAESLSAANLGVPPITSVAGSEAEKRNVMERYRSLTGNARAKFFEAHCKEIWAAYADENTNS